MREQDPESGVLAGWGTGLCARPPAHALCRRPGNSCAARGLLCEGAGVGANKGWTGRERDERREPKRKGGPRDSASYPGSRFPRTPVLTGLSDPGGGIPAPQRGVPADAARGGLRGLLHRRTG